ncbi:glucose-1-phosphate thymidylyltransferase [Nonomuraea sp. NPDC049028]|uniref:glucose-1-phosphate thymidylyltransferase n=1 Tax=Nonomuraea sp. NPDC049028 TaxID=3364348 RepID=UPI003714FE17
MKALILAGGIGTRLRPLSHSMPKQLVPIANKPVVYHGLENIRRAGITDVGIVVGDRGQQIRAEVGDGSRLGLRITYISQSEPLGLAHCVLISRDFLGDDDFVMYLGDNVLLGEISDFVEEFHEHRPAAQVIVTKVTDPSACGIAEIDANGTVVGLEEKPQRPKSDLALMGVYLFTPAVHEAVQSIGMGRRNEWEITDAIQWLVERGRKVRAQVFSGFWRDTGQIEDLLECNRALLDGLEGSLAGEIDARSRLSGQVVVERGVRIRRSKIEGPVIIGADSVIEDSVIGPHTALGSGCAVHDAGIRNSIVLDGTSVRGVHGIHASVIGRSSTVVPSPADPRRHRLIVGDHTYAELAT